MPSRPSAPPHPRFLQGGGETGALVRAFDWAATPLGPPEGWPQPLKMLAQLMLASRQAMFLCWGAGSGQTLYNDAYSEILAGRHPAAMGAAVRGDLARDLGRGPQAHSSRGPTPASPYTWTTSPSP